VNQSPESIKLTQTVQKGGCAAKVAATELRQILSRVQFPPKDQNLLVDGGLFDDAAIYQVTEDVALVQTLDFFTPIVDSPKSFGRIAAANSLSDVYAMGGVPKTAMGILAFPLATLSNDVIVEVLQGACDVMKEVGVSFVGGHSIDDDTLKFGLSVTGYVHPQKIWTNAGAKIGDSLILTKPLGTGAATAGLKRQVYTEMEISEVVDSMGSVNVVIDLLSVHQQSAIHAATDITGFGLAGHSMQMAKASGKTFEMDFGFIPQFQISRECLAKGFLTKAHRTNAQYTEPHCQFEIENPIDRLFLFDPQTSGGLLLSVDKDHAASVVESLKVRFPRTSIIGKVLPASAHFVRVRE